MARLSNVAAERGPAGLAERLLLLQSLTHDDLAACEAVLASLPSDPAQSPSVVARSGVHLLALAGKRLRPLCVALAARAGQGFGEAARDIAVAVELVHTATLLHDDVVDLGDRRRGAVTARLMYGNAASIFAGDWLLVDALRRVRRAGLPGVLERLLDVIEEMIFAESLQLEARGRLRESREVRDVYFRVVEGKTAALFRWAMYAGGVAGGLAEEHCAALESYGVHLGVAFQAIDDLLDFAGSEKALGKSLFTDLREGKITYPLIVALEREPSLRATIETLIAAEHVDGQPPPAPLVDEVMAALHRTGALEECRALADGRAAEAAAALESLPFSAARTALITVAETTVRRER